MRRIRALVYRLGFRPKFGSICTSPSEHVIRTVGPAFSRRAIEEIFEFPMSPNWIHPPNTSYEWLIQARLDRPYTNEFGYCNDPFCDLEEGHKHGPLCHMNCSCKKESNNGD